MMERETIERMGWDMHSNAVHEARSSACHAVTMLAAGKTGAAVFSLVRSWHEQLRANRIEEAIHNAKSVAYPADYHRTILDAARPADTEDRSVLEGLGKLAERTMRSAESASKVDPGQDVDWAKAVENHDERSVAVRAGHRVGKRSVAGRWFDNVYVGVNRETSTDVEQLREFLSPSGGEVFVGVDLAAPDQAPSSMVDSMNASIREGIRSLEREDIESFWRNESERSWDHHAQAIQALVSQWAPVARPRTITEELRRTDPTVAVGCGCPGCKLCEATKRGGQ